MKNFTDKIFNIHEKNIICSYFQSILIDICHKSKSRNSALMQPIKCTELYHCAQYTSPTLIDNFTLWSSSLETVGGLVWWPPQRPSSCDMEDTTQCYLWCPVHSSCLCHILFSTGVVTTLSLLDIESRTDLLDIAPHPR